MDRDTLRRTFDGQADRYDRARPDYPAPLIRDLADLAGIGSGSRVVEIGPGTGQATRALLRLGAHVTAVEPGHEMAERLRRNLAGRDVEVVVSDVETWAAGVQERFDAVVAFTSWHWVDPDRGADLVADLVVPGGALATVGTQHVAGGSDAFFRAAQPCYERWDPDTTPGQQLPLPEDEVAEPDEVDASPRFEPAERRRHQRLIAYTTDQYLDLLRTYSVNIALEPRRRAGLLACLRRAADDHGGRIVKNYGYELRVARTRA